MFLNRCIYLFYKLCISNIILIRQNFVLKFYFLFQIGIFYIVVVKFKIRLVSMKGLGREWWFVLSRSIKNKYWLN